MVMQRLVLAGIAVAVVLASVPLAHGAEKKKKGRSAAPPPPVETSAPTPTEKAAPKAPDIPPTEPGWTAVKVNNPTLARVSYKVDGRDIIVRFRNISTQSAIRVKYTVRWKKGSNNTWVDDSTMEGISFRLKPMEGLDREIRTRALELKDIVIDVEVMETS